MSGQFFEDSKVIDNVFDEQSDLEKPAFKIIPKAKKDIMAGRCPTCGDKVESGEESEMCQKCQNKMFG